MPFNRGVPAGDQEPRIHVLLSGDRIYVANTGAPLSQDGIKALLLANSSPKRGNQIGRFGIGFKSLLRLGGIIDIFSRGVSLRFDPDRCRREIREACGLAPDHDAPALRLAWPRDREKEEETDPLLNNFWWATTIVRAEIREPWMLPHIEQEMRSFPTQFLLFLSVPVTLNIETGTGEIRRLTRRSEGEHIVLTDGEGSSHWHVIEREIRITDEDPRRDATRLHERPTVPLVWAIPLDAKHKEPGRFWAFFPTETESRIPPSDQGRTLDYFPRHLSRQDEPAATLVETLWERIADSAVIPDGVGALRFGHDLRRPPQEVGADLMKVWCALADRAALGRWTHPTSLEGVRGSRLGELAQRLGKLSMSPNADDTRPRLASESAADWFGEIASAEIESKKAAIGLAKAFNQAVKPYSWQSARPTLKIIPSREGTLYCPDDIVVAASGQDVPGRPAAADELTADENSRGTLIDILGVKSVLAEDWRPIIDQALQAAVQSGSDADWRTFWRTLRCASADQQVQFAWDHSSSVLILCEDLIWRHPDAVLLPGRVVSANDSERKNLDVLVDLHFHMPDSRSLAALGVSDIPARTHQSIPVRSIVPWGQVPREDIREILKKWRSEAKRRFSIGVFRPSGSLL
ncbi:MAG TPA: hypothetical protein VES73_11390 [Lamprocystis sp. (in: g-proteobacteria)]|nr:hypothetical protein [Lamprocystis sp. (in: g-proteobacteria)]